MVEAQDPIDTMDIVEERTGHIYYDCGFNYFSENTIIYSQQDGGIFEHPGFKDTLEYFLNLNYKINEKLKFTLTPNYVFSREKIYLDNFKNEKIEIRKNKETKRK